MSPWFTSIVTYLIVCLTLTLEILQRSLVNICFQWVLFWVVLLVGLAFYLFIFSWSEEVIIPNDLCVCVCKYGFNKTDNVEEQSARASSQWAIDILKIIQEKNQLSQPWKCRHVECSHTSNSHPLRCCLRVYFLVLFAFIIQFPRLFSGCIGRNTLCKINQSSGSINNIAKVNYSKHKCCIFAETWQL